MHKMLWGPINKAGRGALKKYFGLYTELAILSIKSKVSSKRDTFQIDH